MGQQGACTAFGTFEFVHRGHLQVVERVVELAKQRELKSVVLSCPTGEEAFTTEREKEYLLKELGVDVFETYRGEQSLKEILLFAKEKLQTEVLVVGEQNEELVRIECLAAEYGMSVEVVETIKYNEIPINREWLIELFEANDFEKIQEICGHPYIMIGDVVHGKKIGRTVGMPTINLHIYKTKRRPNCGVYATKVVLEDKTYLSATNIGRRPTVDDFEYVTIETFILDFNEQIYGEVCILEVHKFLREVQKFESLEEVHEQVQKDVVRVREKFREV